MGEIMFDLVQKRPLEELYDYLDQEKPDILRIFDSQGYNLLHFCVFYARPDHMRVLLHYAQSYSKPDYNTWLNHATKEGLTPLLMSVSKGNFECVQLLIQFNSSIFSRTPLGLNVIHLCAQGNNALILAYFNELRIDLSPVDNKGGTPLHWAAYMGSFNVLSLLLALGVSKNLRDNEGRTPLHLAVMAANEKVARKLIVYGANTEIKDKKDRRPIDIAVESSSKQIFKMLKEPGLMEKVTCKTKLQKPVRSAKHLLVLFAFLGFSFVFIMFFCAKKKSIGTYLLIVLVLIVTCTLFYLITTGPGYIPLPKSANLLDLYKSGNNEICNECRILRPNRSRHCYYCNRCVMRYDHHCQWINNCVGIHNNNIFYFFLSTLIILCLVVDYVSIDVFISPNHDGILEAKNSIIPAAIVIFISTLILYPITLLCIIQTKNYANNKTSSERLSKNRRGGNSSNFFLGNCLRMCGERYKAKK